MQKSVRACQQSLAIDKWTWSAFIAKVVIDDGVEKIIKPKAGRVLIMLSDSRCPHGVKKITDGFRITLPIWYTMNKDVCQF